MEVAILNKKILIGSIIAVAILILVSFTGVVGYQTTKSSTIAKASPLFTIRTSRAIDEDSEDIACDYIGKGEDNFLSIPKRDHGKILIQKVFNIIGRMDDRELKEFIALINDNKFLDNNKYEGEINNIIIGENNSKLFTLFNCFPLNLYFPTDVDVLSIGVPLCIIDVILLFLAISFLIFLGILEIFTYGSCGKCGMYPDTM